MSRCLLLGVLTLALVASASAGEFNKKVNIGDAAPTFSKLPAVDGKNYSLTDFKDKEVLVIAVTTNHCPVARAYEDRIIAFTKKYAAAEDSKVAVVAVNVNITDEDKLDRMQQRAKQKGFNFPYLYDETQAIGRALGAAVTPEFFVLNKERKIVYMGAMDNSQDNPTVDYLTAAVEGTLKGAKLEKTETLARGCGVRYDPETLKNDPNAQKK